MTYRIISKVLIVFALITMLLLPIIFLGANKANADSTTQEITTTSNDYVFFVVDEGQVPLASAPTSGHSSQAVYLVLMAFMSIIGFGYIFICSNLNYNANAVALKVPVHMRSELRNTNAYLHPITLHRLTKDAEYDAARKFLFM